MNNREDYDEIKQVVIKILRECNIRSMKDFYANDVVYERLKAGVVEVFDLDDDEMDEVLEDALESVSKV